MTRPDGRFLILYSGAAILSWASAYPVVRIAMRDLPPIPLAALRYALAALVAVLWLLYRRPSLPARRDLPRLLACGVVGIAFYNIFFNLGEMTVSAGATSMLISSAPLMAALLALLLLGERLSARVWGGSLVSFAGVALIAQGQAGGLSLGSGAMIELAAAFCAALYVILQKPLVQRYGALTVSAYVMIIGAVCLSPWLAPGLQGLERAPPRAWFAVAELGIFPAAIGYAAWAHVIGIMGAARGAVLLYLLPPATLVLAFFLEGEIPGLRTVLGGVIVLGGVAVAHAKVRK